METTLQLVSSEVLKSHSRIPGNNKWSRLLSRLSLHSMHPQSQYLTSSVQEFLSQFLAQRGRILDSSGITTITTPSSTGTLPGPAA